MSATRNAATYVGRIGGLAVALGVGAAIASGAAVASADTTGSSDTSSSSSRPSSNSASDTTKDKPADKPAEKESADTTKDTTNDTTKDKDEADESPTSSSSADDDESSTSAGDEEDPGADTPDKADDAKPDEDKPVKRPKKSSPERDDTPKTTTGTVRPVPDASVTHALSTPVTSATATTGTPTATTVSTLGLRQSANTTPAPPARVPALDTLLGWVRREVERTFFPSRQSSSEASTVAAAAVVDPLPNSLPSKAVQWVTGPNGSAWLDGRNLPRTQNTLQEFGIGGTDLGIMWDGGLIDGQRFVHVAFGDTFADQGMTTDWRSNALLLSFDNDLRNGLGLAPTGYAGQFIEGDLALGLLGSEVTVIPTSGINVDGTQYVNYMSVKSWDTPGRWTTNFSAISQFYPDNGPGDWRIVPSTIRSAGWLRSTTAYRPGDQNFQQMAYVLQPEDQVAEGDPRYLYAFGTPSGRAGSAYLSRVAEGSVTDLSQYEYWDGDSWEVGNAAVAAPVIGDSTRSTGLFGFVVDWANDPNNFGGYFGGLFGAKTGGNVSEMSVQYNEYLDKYVVLYGDGNNNIQMRVADTPEGAWSDPVQLASSAQYPGLYAPMIHPWSGTGALQGAGGSDYNNLYWNMSIWGDYNVVLMQTDLSPLHTVAV